MKRCRLKRYNFQIRNKMSKENKTSDNPQNGNGFIADVSCCTDLEWSLYKQVVSLKEKCKKLEFMIENGLGWEDMRNDITMPNEI
jgi:cell fate regulator YaaT (PSP1 superfamily)